MTAASPAPSTTLPGKTLGIVGVVLAFLAPPLGLILSIVAKVQSKSAGVKNTPATAGIVLSILFIVGFIVLMVTVGGTLFSQCASYGPGVHELDNGTTLTCG